MQDSGRGPDRTSPLPGGGTFIGLKLIPGGIFQPSDPVGSVGGMNNKRCEEHISGERRLKAGKESGITTVSSPWSSSRRFPYRSVLSLGAVEGVSPWGTFGQENVQSAKTSGGLSTFDKLPLVRRHNARCLSRPSGWKASTKIRQKTVFFPGTEPTSGYCEYLVPSTGFSIIFLVHQTFPHHCPD